MKLASMIAATGIAAVAVTGLSVTSAQAADTVTIRPGDLNTSETRATGHVNFLEDGLSVYTEGNTSTDKAAGYFATSGSLPSSASMDWDGTSPQPGGQIVFDADGVDGNGNDYNILVFEPVYGDDVWLTGGSSQTAKDAAPSTEGGSGSGWHGTLAQWGTALPDARFYAGGFSLGSGVKGSGVIHSITYGDTEYRFSNAAVEADPTPYSSSKERGLRGIFTFGTEDRPEGVKLGDKVAWSVQRDGRVIASGRDGFGAEHRIVASVRKNTGRHVLALVQNGERTERVVIRSGRR